VLLDAARVTGDQAHTDDPGCPRIPPGGASSTQHGPRG
jgi:hypothetical protein